MPSSAPSAKRIDSFDSFKGIACLTIVLLHYNFTGGCVPEKTTYAIDALCRIGVPLFFFISGFFLTREDSRLDTDTTLRKIRHVVRLLVVSAIFFILFTIVLNYVKNPNWNMFSYAKKKIVAGRIVRLLVTNDPFVYFHLWFLLALLYSYLFLLIFFGGRQLKYAGPVGIVLLACFSLMQEFQIIRPSVRIIDTDQRMIFYNLFFFRSLSFILLGVSARRYREKITSLKLPVYLLAGAIVVGEAMSVAERLFIDSSQFYIGTYLAVAAIVVICLKKPELRIPGLYHIGRDLSLYVYILHVAVGKTVNMLGSKFRISDHTAYILLRPVVVMVLTVGVSELVFRAVRRLPKK